MSAIVGVRAMRKAITAFAPITLPGVTDDPIERPYN